MDPGTHPEAGSHIRALLVAFLIALGVAWSLTDWGRPALALAAGLLLALAAGNPYAAQVNRASKFLLRASIVGLGFSVPLALLAEAGLKGILVTSVGVLFAAAVGLAVGRVLAVKREPAWLITIGTAICGGSAIAALGAALRARAESMAVALGTVFLLNSIALFVFPPVGALLHLSQLQFGVWASIGIHDTASVVGAASTYGAAALQVATVLKLARTLWIVPLVLLAAHHHQRREPVPEGTKRPGLRQAFPMFILFFVLAAIVAVTFPAAAPAFTLVSAWARRLLTTTLFLIGCTLSRSALKAVGARPLFQGLVTWIVVSAASLAAARALF